MSDHKPLGAQISHMLKDRGVDVIFGIPGVHNQELYRGIEEAGLRHVLARHEQGAGFMADGYARATGRPGVCYLITGPGLCNALTPLGQAFSDSVSVLAIASCLDETAAYRGQLHQMLDQAGAAATVCDWSETAATAEAAFGLVDRALAEFSSQRPRPKALSVPIQLLEAQAPPAPAALDAPRPALAPDCDLARVAEMISAADRPLFIFGGGVADDAVATLLNVALPRWGAASFLSYAADGLVAPDAPLNFGTYLGRPGSADVIAAADLVVAVGTELAEVDLWRRDLGHAAPLVRVDLDPQVLADIHRAQVQIQGCGKDFLHRLADAQIAPATGWDAADVARHKAAWRRETDLERPGIVAICDVLADVLPDATMYYSDMTQFAYVAKEVWSMTRPGHWHHPTGFGTLGYALPAAIGGAVGRPGLPTVAIAGDYGFQYTIQELGTAVELGQPLPILVWDNGKLKEIEDSMVGAQIAPNAVIARNPDFCALARAYGCAATSPATGADLKAAVSDALAADRPTVIHITPAIAL